WRCWSPRARRTARSRPRCSSASGRSPATSPTSTPSSACARARSSPAACTEESGRPGQSSDVLTFSPRRPPPSVDGVPSYPVETYLARARAGERAAREQRAREAAEELSRERAPVRFERSLYVPEDEICFFVFDAPSGRDAALVANRAELEPLRVVEAIPSEKE